MTISNGDNNINDGLLSAIQSFENANTLKSMTYSNLDDVEEVATALGIQFDEKFADCCPMGINEEGSACCFRMTETIEVVAAGIFSIMLWTPIPCLITSCCAIPVQEILFYKVRKSCYLENELACFGRDIFDKCSWNPKFPEDKVINSLFSKKDELESGFVDSVREKFAFKLAIHAYNGFKDNYGNLLDFLNTKRFSRQTHENEINRLVCKLFVSYVGFLHLNQLIKCNVSCSKTASSLLYDQQTATSFKKKIITPISRSNSRYEKVLNSFSV